MSKAKYMQLSNSPQTLLLTSCLYEHCPLVHCVHSKDLRTLWTSELMIQEQDQPFNFMMEATEHKQEYDLPY